MGEMRMKVYLLKLLSFFGWQMVGVQNCENCQRLSLNDLKIEDEYLGTGCVKEKQYYYCQKQNRYVAIYDDACNDYKRRLLKQKPFD